MTQDDLTERRAGLSEAKLALLRRRLRGDASDPHARSGIAPRKTTGPQPLSYTQQRIWFLQQLYPENRAYHMSEAWRMHGPLDSGRLHAALQHIVDRHPSLRTAFSDAGDEPQQQVVDGVRIQLPVTDLAHLSPDQREEAIKATLLATGNEAFALDHPPLLRTALIRLGEDDHVLQLVLHHIITDEWSNDVIWRELVALYGLRATADLPTSDITYTDYTLWQRDQRDSGQWDGQMAYWRAQLAGDLPVITLPTDRPRPAEQSLRGGTVRRMLPSALLQSAQALAQQEGTTLYATLLAAFQALLLRYSHQNDVLVGTPIANRQRLETRDVVGMFINTAVIRAQATGETTYRELLAQTRQTVLDALANQDLPFDLLVQAIQPGRNLSYNPLFQTMFVYRSDSAPRSLPGLVSESVLLDRGVSKFDLTLFAGEAGGQLSVALEYSGDLFDEATAERIVDHWGTLLEAAVADPDAKLATLPLLALPERDLVLEAWNDTSVSFDEDRPIHEVIGVQAARTPHEPAIITTAERLTYGELEARANRLAHRLVEKGVKPGTPVGLYLERSADMVVGILGILKAGGAYVPLEPAYPMERIRFTLHDSGALLVVTQTYLQDRLPATEAAPILIDQRETETVTEPPAASATLDDPAYIIYTSGSTGTPKGVQVTHRNLLASTLARGVSYEGCVSRYLLLSSFAFDSSVAGLFWTLVDGGALVLPEPDGEKDVKLLADLIAAEQVTHTLALPSLYRLLLSYAPHGSLASLRIVIVAGEACPPDLGALHYQQLPLCRLFNEYGPTEATVWCSVYEVPAESSPGRVPIGRPTANSRLYVLDSEQRPVPIGVAGELYVGGEGVTPGYWRNPALTAERFVSLTLSEQRGEERLYRTGDLARWRSDGQLIFLGRVDNQVKLRGYRIELGGIESRLMTYPGVEEAAVIVWEEPGLGSEADRSLVAYVTGPRLPEAAAADRDLRAALSQSLPEYMVPRVVKVLDEMPRTPNGKVDYRRLPSPRLEMDTSREFVAPRTPAEATLAKIWCDVLSLPQVSVEDGFFELGGDSLMSIQVIARARQAGLVITPRQLFRERTIARLAAVASAVSAPAIAARLAGGPVPLAPVQAWFFEQALSHPFHWNQAAWLEAAPDLDVDALQAALAAVVGHHPILRARYTRAGGRWTQTIPENAPAPPLTRIVLAGQPPADQEREMLAAANRMHAMLDLADGPLLRSAWFDLGSHRRPRLLLTIHHLVVDAVSWGILLPDLITAYQQIVAGKTVSLPSVFASYREWVETQSRLVSKIARRELDYWQQTTAGSGQLPRDVTDDSPNTEGAAGLVTVTLDQTRTSQLLRDVHKAYSTRIDDILLAALAQSVAGWSGRSTTLLTMERHGREELDPQLDISRTVGWFTSLFPLELSLPTGGDPGAVIRAVKEQVHTVPQNGVGYGILRYLGDEPTQRKLAQKPQPELLFNYLGTANQTVAEDAPLYRLAEPAGQLYGPENERAHLLDVNAQVREGSLVARWQFASGYFREATVTSLAESFMVNLARLIDHCLTAEQGRHTPSDFPLAELAQDDLDGLSALLDDLD